MDSTPSGPTITCPASPPPITSRTGEPITYAYGTPIATGGTAPLTISCTKESGSIFPIGSTTVVCTVTDARQQTDACSLSVVVVQPPRILATRFVAFGDSITLGEDGRVSVVAARAPGQSAPFFVFPDALTYPGVLSEKLNGRYSAQALSVTNVGVRGEHASDPGTPARFNQVMAGSPFDAVLLMEGSNDVNTQEPTVVPLAIAGLRSMIQGARSRGLRVFLATVPPEVPGLEKAVAPGAIAPFNARVRELAASENVPLVDVEAALAPAAREYIGYDGLHPSEAGYAKIADLFFESIKATLEIMSSPPPTTTTAAVPPRGSPRSRPRLQR